MDSKELLEQKLMEEVERIRDEHKKKFKVKQTIIDYSGIVEIAETMPTDLETVRQYVGGGTMRDSYAQRILNIVLKFRRELEATPTVPNCPTEAKGTDFSGVLSNLSSKLVDLSKSNNRINILKLGRGYLDMSDLDPYEVMSFNFKIQLCDRNKSDEEIAKFDELMSVSHLSNSKKRDTGQNSLYLTYPFVMGKVTGSEFSIRAPLMTIPVLIERDRSRIFLSYDSSRDALFNTDIILFCMQKKGDLNVHAPSANISDAMEKYGLSTLGNSENIRTILSKYYGSRDIELHFGSLEPDRFIDYLSDELESITPNIFQVVPNMILGTFDSSNSSIKRDFDEIAHLGNMPVNIAELLKNSSMENFRDDTGAMDAECKDVSEKDVFYINSLNSAQENIIKALETDDTVVIQGPPGTGKSQTICDIIVTEVHKDRSVLVVTEKQTALDVIKSRLGQISDFIMMLPDSQDKDSFYAQISKAIENRKVPSSVDVTSICNEIDSEIANLAKIYDAYYRPMPGFDIEPYRLYETGRRIDVSTPESNREYERILSFMAPDLFSHRYSEISSAFHDFESTGTCRIIFDYMSILYGFPWIKGIRPDLTQSEIAQMLTQAKALKEKGGEKKGLFGSLKNKVDSERRDFERRFLTGEHNTDEIIGSPDLDDLVGIYERYKTTASAFKTKNSIVQDMGTAAFKVCDGDEDAFRASVETVYDAIITKHLLDLSRSCGDIIGIMQGFDSIIDHIEMKTDEKMECTRANIQVSLNKMIHNLDPRIQDIRMILDRPNRFSIAKFISRVPLLDSFKVWLMTPESVSDILPNTKGLFDYVVIDEASQMYLERSIPSIYRGKKVVIAGDHKQLRPLAVGTSRMEFKEDSEDVDDIVDIALEQESLLDLARFRYANHVLNFHYRAQYEELIAFSNSTFYNNELFVSPNVNILESPPIEYHNVHGVWNNQHNVEEAEYVVTLLKGILRNRMNRETIGVVTFNSSQRDYIFDLIDRESISDAEFGSLVQKEFERKDNGEDTGLFIKNIESVQGDERDIIIFSIGYAKDGNGKFYRRFGVLNQAGGENRINVAVSRAKRKIHVVASIEPSEFDVGDVKNDGPKVLANYLEYAKAVSDRDEERVRKVLVDRSKGPLPERSETALQDLYSYLSSRGYSIKRNVGISTYNIDLAIYDSRGFIVGIEADSSIYPDMPSTRSRDVHRIRYLKSRGWNICRFWVSEYWRNKEAEFDRVESCIRDVVARTR